MSKKPDLQHQTMQSDPLAHILCIMRTAVGIRGNLTIGDQESIATDFVQLRHNFHLYPTRYIISLGISAPTLPILYDVQL